MIKPRRKYFLIISFLISFSAIPQDLDRSNIIDELNEYQRLTIDFIDSGINHWMAVNTNSNILDNKRKSFYTNVLISPNFKKILEKDIKLQESIHKSVTQKKTIYKDYIKHSLEISFKIKYRQNDQYYKSRITIILNRRDFGDFIYRWQLSKVAYPEGMENLMKINEYYGIKDSEVEKRFSNFINELEKSPNILKYAEIHPSIIALAENLQKKNILVDEQGYDIEIRYKLLIPYYIDDEKPKRIRIRYLSYSYYHTIPETKQTGWLIDDEKDIDFYTTTDIDSINESIEIAKKSIGSLISELQKNTSIQDRLLKENSHIENNIKKTDEEIKLLTKYLNNRISKKDSLSNEIDSYMEELDKIDNQRLAVKNQQESLIRELANIEMNNRKIDSALTIRNKKRESIIASSQPDLTIEGKSIDFTSKNNINKDPKIAKYSIFTSIGKNYYHVDTDRTYLPGFNSTSISFGLKFNHPYNIFKNFYYSFEAEYSQVKKHSPFLITYSYKPIYYLGFGLNRKRLDILIGYLSSNLEIKGDVELNGKDISKKSWEKDIYGVYGKFEVHPFLPKFQNLYHLQIFIKLNYFFFDKIKINDLTSIHNLLLTSGFQWLIF